jgi:hypothetical protein
MSDRAMSLVRLISKLGVRKLGVRKFGLLLPGLALLALVSGLAGFRISEAMGLAELQQTGHHRLDLYGSVLHGGGRGKGAPIPRC